MHTWYSLVQQIVEDIDIGIQTKADEALVLAHLASNLGYSKFYTTRKFQALAGMPLKTYIAQRKLAYALIDVRDTQQTILEIAVAHGFSSHEAFTRAFKSLYGVTPSAYRKNPQPVVLRTKINTFDRYILNIGEKSMVHANKDLLIYYVTIPAHKFLHIKNYESDGYFDFWEKQSGLPGQDCDTICGLLDSIKGKLDGDDTLIGQYSGQVMARLYEDNGLSPEAYGIRLPGTYKGSIPAHMLLIDIPEAEYIVFEHGPFDFAQECDAITAQLESAIASYSYEGTPYVPDTTPGRIAYLYNDPTQFLKRVLPIRKK